MAVGEYISVSSQKDTEQADVDKERKEQETEVGRARELDELTQIYVERGLDFNLARQVRLRFCTLFCARPCLSAGYDLAASDPYIRQRLCMHTALHSFLKTGAGVCHHLLLDYWQSRRLLSLPHLGRRTMLQRFCILQVAVALTKDDAVRAHARDELGIDIDDLANPWQVCT